jgi:hypothetical protein
MISYVLNKYNLVSGQVEELNNYFETMTFDDQEQPVTAISIVFDSNVLNYF